MQQRSAMATPAGPAPTAYAAMGKLVISLSGAIMTICMCSVMAKAAGLVQALPWPCSAAQLRLPAA